MSGPGSAADKAGLQRYDIIAKVNGREIKDIFDMHNSIGVRNAGETVTLEVFRDEGRQPGWLPSSSGCRWPNGRAQDEFGSTSGRAEGTRPERNRAGARPSGSEGGSSAGGARA